ncbi:MAG: carbon-nitrogen hydrolase family protein [Pseudomonadota bacterium]
MAQHTVAAVQAAPVLFDPDATLDRFAHWLTEAATAGADLVVFPEAFLGGYPKGVDFGVRVGSRDEAGRDLFRLYYETAFAPDGTAFGKVQDIVAKVGVNVVTGLIEPVGGTLHCAAATLGRRGDVLSWRRKLMPTAMERVIWGFGDGSTLAIAETDIGRVSATICWENYMPLLRQHTYDQGTEIYTAPTVDDRDVWLPAMQMIALEGRCFVVSACQYMTRRDVKDDAPFAPIQGDAPDTVLIGGGSCIVSPFGEIIAQPLRGQTGIVSAEIDMTEIIRGKFDLDTRGHYARPDIFSLEVDDRPKLAPAPKAK